jgi:hypothetical protein
MIDLNGFTLLDEYGLERNPISGVFTCETFTQLIIETWVSYYECHKCSRVGYCKFPIPIPGSSYRMQDIQCGVVVSAISNFIKVTFPLIETADKNVLQDYLDGIYSLILFLFETEVKIGSSMDTEYILSLEKHAPAFFGRFVQLREYLNNIANKFSGIKELQSDRGVLFVEGLSEKAFIDRLRLSHMGWFLEVIADTYGGKGNRRSSRIEMHMERLIRDGYVIYIQGDADGGDSNIFQNLIKKDLIKSENTFVFKYDFETSIPNRLLQKALQNMGLNQAKEIPLCDNQNSSTIKYLLGLGIDISDRKIELAEGIADLINSNTRWIWWQDHEFIESELGKFLLFIRRVQ